MSEENENGGGLAEMLGDALLEDIIEADLLLRYGHDPEALEPAERERVEDYLAASPAHRQQLRSLVQFAEARAALATEQDPTPLDHRGGGEVAEIAWHPRWRVQAAWIGGAIAAGLVAALLYFGAGDRLSPDVEPEVRVADAGAPRERSPSSQKPGAPAIDHRLDPHSRPQERAVAQAEETEPISPEKAPLEQPTNQTGPILAEKAPAPPDTPAIETNTEQPSDLQVVSDEDQSPKPLLLAMNVSGPLRYAPPADATPLATLGGLRSAESELPVLRALAPGHVARTLDASPTLYWYLSEGTDRRVAFVLADHVSIDPVLEITLEPAIDAGIHELRLAEHGVVLEPGKEYRWFVSLAVEEREPSESLVARGAVVRVEPSAALTDALESAPAGDHGRIYAEQGLWYDALDFISRRIDRAPDDARLREFRSNLLEEAGMSEAARYDRRVAQTKGGP
jgi:hypothetical protein